MKKKLISSLLAISMLASMSTTAFAGLVPESNDIDAPNGSTDVPVELTVTPLSFSVTVPSILPITVNGQGEVSVATNTKIVNNSQGRVEVKDLTITTGSSWNLVPMTDDFANKAVNTKDFGMSFNGADAATEELETTFTTIGANSEQAFTYAAKLAPQSEEILGEQIASAVFTIGWRTDVVNLKTFRVIDGYISNGEFVEADVKDFQFEEGMTWGQWVDSEYNTGRYEKNEMNPEEWPDYDAPFYGDYVMRGVSSIIMTEYVEWWVDDPITNSEKSVLRSDIIEETIYYKNAFFYAE